MLIHKLLVLCVVVLSCGAQDVIKDSCNVVDNNDFNPHTFTVNCSRRQLEEIPQSWPTDVHNITEEDHILLSFFNNSIDVVTEIPAIPGSSIAVNFKSNKIIDIEDSAFQNIYNIGYLDLSNNFITGEVLRMEIFQGPYDDGIYDCINLETLNLGFNDIHSLDRDLFQYTPNLTRFYLNNNPIEILDHVTGLALATAVNLEYLDLSYTQIDSIPLDAFRTLHKLQHIDLSGNLFLSVPESLSLVGSTLEYLTFNNNPIVELNDDSFIGLSNLKELEVGENDFLEEVKRSTFSPLTSLKILHLCHNPNLRYISHNAFRGLKDKWTLKEVYLDANDLSELPTDLMPWNKLELLGMTGNSWLCNCDMANIITKQGAGLKFKDGEIPSCVAPLRWSGAFLTNVTIDYCPTFETSLSKKRSFGISDLKPKHVVWSIIGVAFVAFIGTVIGLLVKYAGKAYKKHLRDPVRYVNINANTPNFP